MRLRVGPTRVRTKKVQKGSTIDFFWGGDPARTVKYHDFATTTQKISPFDLFTAAVGNKKGLLQHWQRIFLGGTLLELENTMVLQLPPLKNFTVAIFCKYVCANITIYIMLAPD